MKTLTVNIPDDLEITNKDLSLMVAAKLYEQAKVSLGQAAEIAGLSKVAFAELLGTYGVSIFNFSAADLSNDIANA
ncbi:MAG: UPF0175 family protein [Flavipsychrobacter sp.]|jgi:predicted HTH domain antitoxin|nr:UPF0175 family protein [Flavipsychrobacter sp.]